MKLTAGKRVLMFFHWLFSALICAAFAAYLIKPEYVMDLYNKVTAKLTASQIMVIGIAILAVYVILAVSMLFVIFRRARATDRGFITVDSSDSGRVRIAVSAIEQMVRQSVTQIDGIHEMKVNISSEGDAIRIDIVAIIEGGRHVPTITMNMQRAIRQFVEMNCGVAVRSIYISINSVTPTPDAKGRRGRKHDVTPVPLAPSPEAVDASRPVEPSQPVESAPYEPEPEPVAQEKKEAEEPEGYQIPDEPAPIKLTLDYEPQDSYDNGEESSEAPETSEDEDSY